MDLSEIQDRMAQWVEANPRSAIARRGVQSCPEFRRVDALPRRVWAPEEEAELADILTAMLRTPSGAQRLRPKQAVALYEIALCGGLLGPIRVGAGKTLISFLGPRILASQRPLLVLPAKLVKKTKAEMAEYSRHWNIARNITIVSYEWLSREKGEEFLSRLKPDCILFDEGHRIRNKRAARTKKLIRYCTSNEVHVIVMSGTLIRKRLLDWAHLSYIALGEGSPAPKRWGVITQWGMALDEGGTTGAGALYKWCDGDESYREAYRRRIIETPGVVATIDGLPGVALNIEPWSVPIPSELTEALKECRNEWSLPDGATITDPLHAFRAERQLALGCYYRWRVAPPPEWLEARRQWGAFVRHAVRYLRPGGRYLDSELQVVKACQAGELNNLEYLAWQAIKPTFFPDIEHVWLTTAIAEALIELANEDPPAIVWVESVAVGRLLDYAMPYYGAKGEDKAGRPIEQADPLRPLAASVQSSSEGRNLQAWSRAIVTAPMPDATVWEQLLGRIHRDGQEADECSVRWASLCVNHRESFARAIDHAYYLEQSTGQPQKLLQATMV